jgi:hypothetical protein
MTILKTGTCFTAELTLNCPTIVDCVTALPVGAAGVAGTTQVLGKDGQFHTLPAAPVGPTPADGSETKVTAGTNTTVTGAGTIASPYVVSSTATAASTPFATPAETIAGTATTLAVNPADLYARENIPAQTGLGLVLSAIPAPAANQSPWGVNTLGETLHYAPGVGWQIVDYRYHQTVNTPAGVTTPSGVWGLGTPVTAPRAGRVLITSKAVGYNAAAHFAMATGLFKNGSQITQSNMGSGGLTGTAPSNSGYQAILQTPSIIVDAVAGDVFAFGALSTGSSIEVGGFIQLTYL